MSAEPELLKTMLVAPSQNPGGRGRAWEVGDAAKVWSRSMQTWGHGSVKRVEGDMILVEFTLSDGNGQWGSYSKGLHKDDELLQPGHVDPPGIQADRPLTAHPAARGTAQATPQATPQAMERGQEDRLHMHVIHYMQQRSDIAAKHRVERQAPGVYLIDGRSVQILWEGGLTVVDGPLRQPFYDYLLMKDSNAVFNADGLRESNLNRLPKATRHTFQDEGRGYSRLDAMKVAKEQALFREKAAEYLAVGQSVPSDLMDKYQKQLEIKLGRNFLAKQRWSKAQRSQQASPQEPGPQPAAVKPAAASPPAGIVMVPAAPAPPVAMPSGLPMQAAARQAPVAMPGDAPKQASLFGQMPNLIDDAVARAQVPRQAPSWQQQFEFQCADQGNSPVPCRA